MTDTSPNGHPRYITRRVTYRIPLVGRMAREVVEGPVDNAFAAILGVVCSIAIAVLIWGLPALIVSALISAAVVLIFLLRITLG